MKRKIVGSMSEWSGMLKDLFRQINDGSIGQEEIKRFLEHKNPFKPESRADAIERLIKAARDKSNFLHLISGDERIVIAPTSGEIITKANGVFDDCIDFDFRNWIDEAGKSTPETPVQVYEMTQDATLAQIFSDPDKMTLTQGQIIYFAEKHRRWLRQDGRETFFLFRSYGKFFVANVYVCGGKLCVRISWPDHDNVWHAEYRHRVIIPQPA
ncbi:MAG: hypothetical protein M1334_02925 [Patescibacteria group bacterium]|nr:hypothetical protein [Patescibacteria group bacterium]